MDNVKEEEKIVNTSIDKNIDNGFLSMNQVKHFINMMNADRRTKRKRNTTDFPAEALYANHIAGNPLYAVADRESTVSLYKWKSTYWRELTKHEAIKDAYYWLTDNAPEVATNRTAVEAYKTALLDAMPLPGTYGTTLIPLEDCWVLVSDDGTLTVALPDSNVGVTYKINASLKAPLGAYTPKPIKKDSLFRAYLDSSIPDKEVQCLLQEYAGYTLLNDTRFQVALCNLGMGKNGKSIFMAIIIALHAKIAAIRLDKMENFGLAPLVNASLAVCAETPKHGINEQILKACISSDPVSIELKGVNEFTYRPTAKFIINMNSFPKIHDESDGIWRRLMIVEWKVQFDPEKQIKNLDTLIIENELDQVVNWCLEGLQRLLKRGGFKIPSVVSESTTREREISNTVEQYCDAYFVIEDTAACSMLKEDFYSVYLTFCKSQNYLPLGNVEFWKRIRQSYPRLKEEKKTILSEDGATHTVRKKFINLKFNGDGEVAADMFEKTESQQ